MGEKKMLSRKFVSVIFAITGLLAMTTEAFACACCIDPGYYEISTLRPKDYDIATFEQLKFDTAAELYESEAGFDGIRGLDDLRKLEAAGQQFDLSAVETFAGKTWQLTIKSSTGSEGTLVLPMPRSMVKFKVDLHDNEPGTEPGLYKEFRLKGVVSSGTGMFKKDIVRPTSYFLIFQGRGNGCDSSSDFTHWHLELNGTKADYSFFGK